MVIVSLAAYRQSFYTSSMKPDEPMEGFVSRRGKRVTADSVNVSELSIDNVPGEALDEYKTPRKPSSDLYKKKWVWIAVLILIAVPVLSGELLTWRYGSSATGAKNKLSEVVSKSVLSVQTSSNLSAAQIGQITDKVDGIASGMCPGSFLDNAAMLYPRAKSAHSECVAAQEKYSALATSLRQYETERRYLEQLGALVRPLGEPLSEKFAVIGSQLDMWQRATEGMQKLSPPDTMRIAHTDLTKHADAIRGLWSKLLKAYDDQDSTTFSKTSNALAGEYKKFQISHTTFSSLHESSQAKITTAFQQI